MKDFAIRTERGESIESGRCNLCRRADHHYVNCVCIPTSGVSGVELRICDRCAWEAGLQLNELARTLLHYSARSGEKPEGGRHG